MSKLDNMEKLLYEIRSNDDQNEKDADFDRVNGCVESYTDYHNEAVNQGRLITMAKFRLDDDRFVRYINDLHEKRKDLHRTMIRQTIVLNGICEKYGLPGIYSGPLDKAAERDDPDTRFGVAEFGEELCRDFFRTTHEISVPEKAVEAYKEHAANIKNNSGSWNVMQRMMEKMDAQNKMDASVNGPDR